MVVLQSHQSPIRGRGASAPQCRVEWGVEGGGGGGYQAGWHSTAPLGLWAAPTLSLECRRTQEVQRLDAGSVPVRAIKQLNAVCLRRGHSRPAARHRSATKSTPVRLSVPAAGGRGRRLEPAATDRSCNSSRNFPLTSSLSLDSSLISKMFLNFPLSA